MRRSVSLVGRALSSVVRAHSTLRSISSASGSGISSVTAPAAAAGSGVMRSAAAAARGVRSALLRSVAAPTPIGTVNSSGSSLVLRIASAGTTGSTASTGYARHTHTRTLTARIARTASTNATESGVWIVCVYASVYMYDGKACGRGGRII